MGSTRGRTTSDVACHLRLWAAHTVERCRAWHDIIALGQHTRSNDVRQGMTSPPLGSTHGRTTSRVASYHRLWTSSHCRTASGVECHHRPWTANTVEQRLAWQAIIALGRQTRSNDVGRGMPSSPLGSTHGLTTSGVACNHCLWAAQTVERRRVWHDIMALGLQARSDDVGRCMPS